MKFYCIPTCSTCKAAKNWLREHEVEFEEINLKMQPPSKNELESILMHSELPLKRFFNTSGTVYKEKGLKNKIAELTIEEAAELLSSDGMLIKRPLVLTNKQSIVGFKAEQYEQIWQQEKEKISHGK